MKSLSSPASVVPHRRRERAVAISVTDSLSPGRFARVVPDKDDPYWGWRPLDVAGGAVADHRLEWRPKEEFSREEIQLFFVRGRGRGNTVPTGAFGPLNPEEYGLTGPTVVSRKGDCKSPHGKLLKELVAKCGAKSLRGFRPNYFEVRCSACGIGACVSSELPIAGGLARAVKDLRDRWGSMPCDEVADHLVVREVMES